MGLVSHSLNGARRTNISLFASLVTSADFSFPHLLWGEGNQEGETCKSQCHSICRSLAPCRVICTAPRSTGVPESVSKCRLARGDLFPSEDFDFQIIIPHAAVTPRMSKHEPNAQPVSRIALKRQGREKKTFYSFS